MNAAGPLPVVCVVDDDDPYRDSLVWLLEGAGYRVASYSSAEALLQERSSEEPAVLLLDVSMPGLSGLELQSELARRRYGNPIVFVTGHADVPLAVSAMQRGAFHFLEKPFNDDVLLEVVARAAKAELERRGAQARRAAVGARLERLTPREREVMDCVIAGKLNKVTADELGVSVKTVEAHRSQLMKKLQVDSTAQLVRLMLELKSGAPSETLRRKDAES